MIAFFPFNPRTARRLFWLGAFACAGLCASAVAGARWHAERHGEARAGVCAALTLAFGYGATRLRPRAGWGVTLGKEALVLARPLGQGSLEIPWEAVANVRREGRSSVVLFLDWERLDPDSPAHRPEAGKSAPDEASPPVGGAGTRVNLARHLFASDQVFGLLFEALRIKVPERHLDA